MIMTGFPSILFQFMDARQKQHRNHYLIYFRRHPHFSFFFRSIFS
ncbi:hypothetical protein HMPREF1992_00513 [Selenomonas sp. oral taxon 892 str. F0426]|nr:hypothetical protein HMPREF1992_00513 [Selenomonas sp. oral taxon 892 str. F0426]